MSIPTVTVILPTYNRVGLFARALCSILSQTFPDFEVIVIENGCTDGTSAFLDTVKDMRLRRIRTEKLIGASAARNLALGQAQSEFLAFQDDDDIWLPDKLERQLAQLRAAGPEYGLCLCGKIALTASGVEGCYDESRFRRLDFRLGTELVGWGVIATPGWLARRELVEAVGGFDEQMPARNDWELALRLSQRAKITYVAAPLFIQDQSHVTTMRRNPVAYAQGLKRIEALHGHLWKDRPKVKARHAWVIAKGAAYSGNKQEARAWLLLSIRYQPWVVRTWLLLMLTLVDLRYIKSLMVRRESRLARSGARTQA